MWADNNNKFIITIDCRGTDRETVNDYVTSLLYGPKDGSGFAGEFDVIIDNIFVDEDDY